MEGGGSVKHTYRVTAWPHPSCTAWPWEKKAIRAAKPIVVEMQFTQLGKVNRNRITSAAFKRVLTEFAHLGPIGGAAISQPEKILPSEK